ncbi:MAG TPA: IS3 family transposase [Candidatus Ligilactobacillus faecavium]|nr:IS3 family transposase [Candidatus Ligilactobacillus faecavium]
MRFSKEDKINMYHMYQKGYRYSEIKGYYPIGKRNFYYLVQILNRYGIAWLDRPRHKWTNQEKKEAIDRVLINHESRGNVALDLGLSSVGMLSNWIRDYRKNGYNVIDKPIGRPREKIITKHNQKKINIKDKKIKELEKELLYLRAENAYLKALRELAIKAKVIEQLRCQFPLSALLKAAKMSRSTFYYQRSHEKDRRNKDVMFQIKKIFNKHHGNYGYRRITCVLRHNGIIINHKKVKRLMKVMGLFGKVIRKRNRYSSYKGTIGKIADNKVKRQFSASQPKTKCYTDVTKFKLNSGEKVYLSPILDGYNEEIITYDVSTSPTLHQTFKMLNQLDRYGSLNGMILHSGQGWQYQHSAYQSFLKGHGIIQSMSRKGNSLDSGMMENFFSVLKREMFYGYEDQYKNTDELIQAIHQYIQYYNNDRIKVKLKGLSPVQYRTQSQIA